MINEKKAYKYPYVASELLASGNPFVLSFFETTDKEGKLVNYYPLFQ
jgi:hypothetical protein